ncbi:class I SAM-dependent methyltransferase [Thermoflavifilum thermophilum]|uniref:Predicted O-methyltransferase YrrM n=1 Tax=Thermoflavifilum thermophilum TaxID=1393122 RepID=A0A1I7N9V4_9BACT|nr:class I SAM-dependent methyltransferase [Thermoflavifilum thermophilum]SFV31363.1 Predicted O-methyltransferase YrrM [Thermoflavifilum thermophilum]
MMKGKAFVHYVRIKLGFDRPHTQTTWREQQKIKQYSKGANLAAEIGVYEGVNTLNIALSMSEKGTLYAIDPFFPGILGICWSKLIARHTIQLNGFMNKVIWIEDLSSAVASMIPENLDFIFIDGDHTWNGIEADWLNYSKKVSIGGYIALHDTHCKQGEDVSHKLDTYKYYREVIAKDERFEEIDSIDSLSVLRRKA